MLAVQYGELLDDAPRSEIEQLAESFNTLWLIGHHEDGTHIVNDPTSNVAPADVAYVTVGAASGLANERSLTGTAGEVDITDNGAGSTVAIGLPAVVVVTTSVSAPSLLSVAAITATPATGSNLNVVLSGAGDLAVNTNQLYVDTSAAAVGIGTATPLAALHLKAGTATANTGPLKFTSGTKLTTAEPGAVEYNGNFLASNAALRFPLGGTLFDAYADVTVGGAEADVFTHTLAANTFNTNGDKVIASYSGNFVTVGTELTRLQVYLAGTAIWDSTGLAPASGTTSWRVFVELIRVSGTVVRYSVSLNTTGASGYVYAKAGELTGLTLSGTNVLKITGVSTGVGSGSGDIVGKMAYVEFKPGA